jgi:hypothetical protein
MEVSKDQHLEQGEQEYRNFFPDKLTKSHRIKVHFNDSKGNLLKTVEANEGDDLLAIAHEYDIDLEGTSHIYAVRRFHIAQLPAFFVSNTHRCTPNHHYNISSYITRYFLPNPLITFWILRGLRRICCLLDVSRNPPSRVLRSTA